MILFKQCRLVAAKAAPRDGGTGTTINGYEVVEGENLPPILVSRFTRTGTAVKEMGPVCEVDNQGNLTYSSFWCPLGMEGWTVKIQATLVQREGGPDGITSWVNMETGNVVLVASNACNENGFEVEGAVGLSFLKKQSIWYIDSLTVRVPKGVAEKASMEMTIVRGWTDNE